MATRGLVAPWHPVHGSTQWATQLLPLPPSLHPRLGTKDFILLAKMQQQQGTPRGPQLGSQGSTSPRGAHVCSLNHGSAADRLPPWGLSPAGLIRWKPRWSDLNFGAGHRCHFTIWAGTGMVSFTNPETLQTVGGYVRQHVPGSRGMEGAVV